MLKNDVRMLKLGGSREKVTLYVKHWNDTLQVAGDHEWLIYKPIDSFTITPSSLNRVSKVHHSCKGSRSHPHRLRSEFW